MRAFIVDFNEWVKQSLGDPSFSKRVTPERILRELEVKHVEVYENILRISSGIGYSEATITLVNDKEFYPLPGNFRRFRGFEKRLGDDPNQVSAVYRTLHPWEPGPGIEILSGQRGFFIRPRPVLASDETWVLKYQAGPVILHYGTARAVGDKYIDFQNDPPAAQGEIIASDGYYQGSLIGIVSADTGVGQVVECSGYVGASNRALLRHSLSPIPTGDTIIYEIRPILPRPYHKLIALGAAITFAAERRDFQGRATLIHEWRELWRAAKNYFGDTTIDSAPRFQDVETSGFDPYELGHL